MQTVGQRIARQQIDSAKYNTCNPSIEYKQKMQMLNMQKQQNQAQLNHLMQNKNNQAKGTVAKN